MEIDSGSLNEKNFFPSGVSMTNLKPVLPLTGHTNSSSVPDTASSWRNASAPTVSTGGGVGGVGGVGGGRRNVGGSDVVADRGSVVATDSVATAFGSEATATPGRFAP